LVESGAAPGLGKAPPVKSKASSRRTKACLERGIMDSGDGEGIGKRKQPPQEKPGGWKWGCGNFGARRSE
jgi:hypothetical protein